MSAAEVRRHEPVRRLVLPAALRLREIPELLAQLRVALSMNTMRIELDASELRLLTEGARRVLLVATEQLAQFHVELVLVDCDPFD